MILEAASCRMGSREEQTWVFVSLPVETKELQNASRQRGIAIVVTFAVSDVKEHAVTVDVADLEVETFAEPQAAGVEGGEEDSMARKLDVIEQESDFLSGEGEVLPEVQERRVNDLNGRRFFYS